MAALQIHAVRGKITSQGRDRVSESKVFVKFDSLKSLLASRLSRISSFRLYSLTQSNRDARLK